MSLSLRAETSDPCTPRNPHQLLRANKVKSNMHGNGYVVNCYLPLRYLISGASKWQKYSSHFGRHLM